MLIIDPTLIGRKYYTTDKNTQYTIRGVADGTGTVVLIGEDVKISADTLTATTHTRLTTTKVTDAKLLY